MELSEAIFQFAESRRQRLDTPSGAYCMCDSTSDAFIRWARDNGVTVELNRYDFDLNYGGVEGGIWVSKPHPRNPDPTLYQTGKHDMEVFMCAGWHSIVETPHFFVDFTARQYHSAACYPHIIAKKVAEVSAAYVDPDDVAADTIAAAAAAGGE